MSLSYGGMVLGHGWFTGASSSGKTAVQLLQESKSRYVKSDRVLVTCQEPSRPDRYHISTNPNIFLSASSHTLHASRLSPPDKPHEGPTRTSKAPPPIPPRSNVPSRSNGTSSRSRVIPLTSVALALHSGTQACGHAAPPLPSRSPRVTPRPRAKTQPVGDILLRGGDLRRSLSHGPADRNNDVQMKLRELLNVDSRESLCPLETQETLKERLLCSQNEDGTFRAVVAAVTTHKSLPELSFLKIPDEVESLSETKSSCERRPSCPGAIHLDVKKKIPSPPPRPPRWTKESPPIVPARPPPRPPPPKIPLVGAQQSPKSRGTMSNAFSHKADGEISSESGVSEYGGLGSESNSREEHRRRPILRSKSDVSHERHGSSRWEEESRRSSYCSEELNQFFNSMGLDGATLKDIESPPQSEGSSPVYFEETSSQDSGQGARRGSSDSDEIRTPLNSSGGQFLSKRSLEPSIIEKNARVIKWLFNCQKARFTSLPRSLSSGS